MPEILTPQQHALPPKIDRQGSDVPADFAAAAEVEAPSPHLHLVQPAAVKALPHLQQLHQPLQPSVCATTAGSYAMTYPSIEQACAQNSRLPPVNSLLLMLSFVSMVIQPGTRCRRDLMNLGESLSGCVLFLTCDLAILPGCSRRPQQLRRRGCLIQSPL